MASGWFEILEIHRTLTLNTQSRLKEKCVKEKKCWDHVDHAKTQGPRTPISVSGNIQ
jgi:hypothetical protein